MAATLTVPLRKLRMRKRGTLAPDTEVPGLPPLPILRKTLNSLRYLLFFN